MKAKFDNEYKWPKQQQWQRAVYKGMGIIAALMCVIGIGMIIYTICKL